MADSGTFDIKDSIATSVAELFDTMLDMEAVPIAEEEVGNLDGRCIIGTLSFAGEVIGNIDIQLTDEASRIVTAAMLGMEPEEIEDDEEIKDVVREVCNIVGGNLKSGFEDVGLQCVISTPSITSGDDFEIETLNMDRYDKFGFKFDDQVIYVELAVKAAEHVAPEARAKLTAVDISKFSRLDIIESTGDTVIELFDVMLGMEVEMSDTEGPSDLKMEKTMGEISFAGEVTGSLQFMVSTEFARLMTSAILGMEPGEIDDEEEVKDVIGEVTNITAGNLKAAFNDSGLGCKISPPHITTGTDFTIETAHMDRTERYAFKLRRHEIFVEVCVKIDDMVEVVDEPIAKAETTETETAAPAPAEAGSPAAAAPQKDAAQPAAEEEIPEDQLQVLLDIPLQLSVELGRTKMKIEDLLNLHTGSTLVHQNLEGEPLDVLANDTLIARGEVIVENEKYGIRITEVVSSKERIASLRRDPLKTSGD
jgi:flagellar motor switch protein FliN